MTSDSVCQPNYSLTIRSGSHPVPSYRRATRHRPHPRHAGRQDRAEPADERDAGGDGAGDLQVVVRGLRPRPRQGRRPRPRPAQAPSPIFSPTASRTRSWARFRGVGGVRVAEIETILLGKTPSTKVSEYWTSNTMCLLLPSSMSHGYKSRDVDLNASALLWWAQRRNRRRCCQSARFALVDRLSEDWLSSLPMAAQTNFSQINTFVPSKTA